MNAVQTLLFGIWSLQQHPKVLFRTEWLVRIREKNALNRKQVREAIMACVIELVSHGRLGNGKNEKCAAAFMYKSWQKY